jgi:hypothetical protein
MTLPASLWRDEKLTLIYPFDWSGIEDFSTLQLDAQDIPHVYLGSHLGRRYDASSIARYGLHFLSSFAREGRVRHQFIARSMAEWLVEHQVEWKNGIGAWVYDYDQPFYRRRAPWISAAAQGEAISLLLRMSQMGDSKTYEAAAHRAVRAFIHPVAQGGVVQSFPDGSPAFEEYPSTPRSLVLNGLLFALIGLRDYALHFSDAPSQKLFELCVAGLKKNLARYDAGYWTLYDLHPSRRLAGEKHVRIRVQLLHIIAKLSADDFFARAAKRWEGQRNNTWCRVRFKAAKVIEKIRLHRRSYF